MGKRRKVISKYFRMSEEELRLLPAFDVDGGVVFYDVGGGYLLGRDSLIRAVKYYWEDRGRNRG